MTTNKDFARKLEALEKQYDAQFKVVFDWKDEEPDNFKRKAHASLPASAF